MLSKIQLKSLCALKVKKYRKESGKFLIDGIKLCKEALNSNYYIENIFICPALLNKSKRIAFLKSIRKKGVEVTEISIDDLQKLSDTVHSQGVIALVHNKRHRLDKLKFGEKAIIVVMENLADPGNVGTIIRTADWFGTDALISGKDAVELYNPKVIRSTMGSLFHLPIIVDANLPKSLSYLKQIGFRIYAATLEGEKRFDRFQFADRTVIVVGNESAGLSPELVAMADETICIPGANQAESLNVAVATGILLFQAFKGCDKTS